jgi:hypothetical protein
MVLTYGERSNAAGEGQRLVPEAFVRYGIANRNLSIYGPDRACIGGVSARWSAPSRSPAAHGTWPFWDSTAKQFTLGDFSTFASFLELFIGFGSVRQAPGGGVVPPADEQPQEEASEP